MSGVSRRAFLGGVALPFPLLANGRGSRWDSPEIEFLDPLTERKMSRLTDPRVLHHLPHYHHRLLSRKGDALLLGGELSGDRQIFLLELKRGRLTQLTAGPGVESHSATMDAREKAVYFIQANAVFEGSLRGRGDRQLYSAPPGWRLTGHLSVDDDASAVAVIEMREGDQEDDPEAQFQRQPLCRLRVAPTDDQATPRTLVEEERWLTHPQFRPGTGDLLYLREGPLGAVDGRVRFVSSDGAVRKSLTPRQGDEQICSPAWSADGSVIHYVFFPDDSFRRAAVRSVSPENIAEQTISPCTAFGWMDSNEDGTAMVGASRRPSGPNIYVLFTRLRREITLCEHFASGRPYPIAGTERLDFECAQPNPIFSADSQWVYFSSDREGLPAIYRMKLEDLVNET